LRLKFCKKYIVTFGELFLKSSAKDKPFRLSVCLTPDPQLNGP